MPIKSFAEYYHQETKYSPQGLSKNQRQIDWTKQPLPFKEYKKGKNIELASFIAKKKTTKKSELSPESKNLEALSKFLEVDYFELKNMYVTDKLVEEAHKYECSDDVFVVAESQSKYLKNKNVKQGKIEF